jgi:hypothetical protein
MLPNVSTEDHPPMLRFQQVSLPDPIATEQTGRSCYMNAIQVDVSAAGDMKNVVPYIAEQIGYDADEIDVTETKKVVEYVILNGKQDEKLVEREVRTKKTVYTKKVISPWTDVLKHRLKHGQISQGYFDSCMARLHAFKQNITIVPDGIPLADWTGVNNEALKKRAIELGISTVELAAAMDETAIEQLGFGARDMKNRARAFLEADRSVEKIANKLVNLERRAIEAVEENDALKNKIATLEALVAKGAKAKKGKQEETEEESL